MQRCACITIQLHAAVLECLKYVAPEMIKGHCAADVCMPATESHLYQSQADHHPFAADGASPKGAHGPIALSGLMFIVNGYTTREEVVCSCALHISTLPFLFKDVIY